MNSIPLHRNVALKESWFIEYSDKKGRFRKLGTSFIPSTLLTRLRHTSCTQPYSTETCLNEEHTQKNGAVSKVIKRFMAHPMLAQLIFSKHKVSKFPIRYQPYDFHVYCGTSLQDGATAGEGFLRVPFEVSISVITVQREFRVRFKNYIILL
jgi:hypothetical protein